MKHSILLTLSGILLSFSAMANDTIRIYSNGCDDYQTFIGPHGGQLTMTANSDQWSHFVRWNDGNTDNPRTITTNGNADYTAVFEAAPCILASGTCGAQGNNLIWELSCDSLLTISGSGAMADYSSGSAPWYTNRTSITSIIINNGVTSIGNYAFQNCSGLTSVTIPSSVTSIGSNAFSGCSGLAKVNITDIAAWCNIAFGGSTANPLYYAKHLFVNDVEVTELIIPNGVTSIGQYAFYTCSGLTSVTIPNSVTSIGNNAFYGCSGLAKVNITDIAAWCNIAFGGSTATNPLYYAKHLFVNDIEVTELVIPNSVTSIEQYAFYNCSGLTSVTIPNSVTSIGTYAFQNCSSLTSVTIGNSVTSIGTYAFQYCSSLTSVTIPNSVTSIGKYAFNSCTGLTSVTIGNSVTSIGTYAFGGCRSLTSVTIPNSVTSIGSYAFYNCSSLTKVNITDIAAWCNIAFTDSYSNPLYCAKHLFVNDVEVTDLVIPNSVASIGKYAFYNCSGLTSVTIPNSVTSIGNNAFYNCSGLSSVTIPSDVSKIGANAFYRVNSIIYSGEATGSPWGAKSVNGYVDGYLVYSDATKTTLLGCSAAATGEIVIPSSVTSIGKYAFNSCTGLTSVTIPNSVTSIGGDAFSQCSGLTKVNITDIAAWCNIAFGGSTANPLFYAKHLFVNDVEVTDLVIPNSVTSIGGFAFFGCSGLTSVTIPNSVTSIGERAFYNCSSLTSVTIPNSVTSIGEFAFNGCTGLTSVTIPNSVTSIGSSAFSGCSGLTSVTIPNSVTSIGGGAFYGCSSLTDIYVCGDLERFQQLLNNDDRIKVGMPYSITINAEHGNVSYPQTMCDDMLLNATPDYGYHFVKWSDGNTANPRAIELTRDTTFTALFAPNQYTLSLQCDGSQGVVEGAGVFDYLAQVQISATPAYGYHFTSWSDGNTANPRTITIAKDVTLTVNFAPNIYKLNVSCNAEQGSVTGSGSYTYLSNRAIEAIPSYGYHFAQWNDGNTNNPRTFELTRDTTFTAQFAPNQYTLSLQCDENQGSVEGAGLFDFLAQVQISATPAYGYHFSSWSDGNTDNPRTISVTEDKSYTATFAKNTYSITKIANNEQGSVSGPTQGEYLDNITLTVTPEYGYHFAQWNDGNTDNPRTFELTRDTTFTAQFAPNQYTLSLQCDNNQGSVEGAGLFDYLAQVQISATPAYGYHFSSWSDGNTDNPRTISVTEDKSYTATFAKNTYTITKIANNEQGSVSGPTQGEYLDNISLTATPEYGYHFAQWNDGNTDNPRTFVLTKDTTFTAQFAPNQYTLSLQCDNNQGTVEGAGVFDYLAQVQISATPAYGYHFSSWSDGNTDNPRTYTVTKDVTLIVNFAPNTYTLNVSCNAEQGSVTGSGSYNYLSNRAIEAIPSYGYHFTQWSDGNIDNPRTIELRQDTAFVAIFAVDKYGTCGDNLQLTWRYDTGSQTLTISGDGDLTTNMRYGVEAVKEMKELIIEDGVGVIGNEAFANIKTLNTITLGKDVRKLQERVFYNCYNLTAIYNYRKTPASATSNTFEEVDKYACTIYVLAGSEEMFRNATGWKDFYSILTIGASETTVTDNNATVVPSANTATVTWPVSNDAVSYTIDITKDGVVFCRLTFNANGQLTGIAFAPGRDGQSMAPAALMTANGLQFTVTGLSSNTQYGYSITATDAEDTEVASYSGTFTTTGEIATDIDAQQSDIAPFKFIRDNQVLILRDGKTYTLQGQEVR